MIKNLAVVMTTAVITWLACSLFQGSHLAADRVWLRSAVKAPGRMALAELQRDMEAGAYELAKAKLKVLNQRWRDFESGPDRFRGPGIGDIMIEFSTLEKNRDALATAPGDATIAAAGDERRIKELVSTGHL